MQLLKTETIFLSSEKVLPTCKRSYTITVGILRPRVGFYVTEGKTAYLIQNS